MKTRQPKVPQLRPAKREATVAVRASQREVRQWYLAATAAGQTISAWVRHVSNQAADRG